MSGPEGWDGMSVRAHIEHVSAEVGQASEDACEAREIAETACDELATLAARIAALEARLGIDGEFRHILHIMVDALTSQSEGAGDE